MTDELTQEEKAQVEQARLDAKLYERVSGGRENPTYTTDSGAVLKLQAIRSLVINRWDQDYKKRNPPPEPPMITLENGDRYPNAQDPTFIYLSVKWNRESELAGIPFMLQNGVASDAPKDWKYPFPDLLNGSNPPMRLLWLETILTNDDLALLPRAIMGIDKITEEGLKEAEKN